jgi:pyridoxine/pyridoxamine 5'-phosphate oxidase
MQVGDKYAILRNFQIMHLLSNLIRPKNASNGYSYTKSQIADAALGDIALSAKISQNKFHHKTNPYEVKINAWAENQDSKLLKIKKLYEQHQIVGASYFSNGINLFKID